MEKSDEFLVGRKPAKEPNVYLYDMYDGNKKNVLITTGVNWYTRLWYLITNPLRYLFTGVWKF